MKPSSLFVTQADWAEVKLGEQAKLIKSSLDWLDVLEEQYKAFIYGGYLEDRHMVFDARHDAGSTIHLGIDYWLSLPGARVHFPYDGYVLEQHPASDNCRGGWGNRLDVFANDRIYILGHLAPRMAEGHIFAGNTVGTLGTRQENGGWKPHLHVQCVSVQEYNKFANKRDIDAYAPFSEDLKERYPKP